MGDSKSIPPSARVLYGKRIVADFHARLGQSHTATPVPDLSKRPRVLPSSSGRQQDLPPVEELVGIVGGGAAGLYAAMLLKSMGWTYRILEAGDRFGGRMYTHKFPNGGKYDYYDVGAMRFPDTPYMKRTFDLFRTVGVPTLPYKFKSGKTFLNFNNKVFQRDAAANGPVPKDNDFGINEFTNTDNIDEFADYADPIDETVEPFRQLYLKEGFEALWAELMKYDHMTLRDYMLGIKQYSAELVNWLETYDNSTNSYDRAFTEAVLDSIAFDYPTDPDDPNPPKYEWHCVDGGSSVITDKMYEYLDKDVPGEPWLVAETGARVTAIEYDDDNDLMVVRTTKSVYRFMHVITTIPLPVLNVVDLRECQLIWPVKAAFRKLTYGASTKIGIKFTENWWWKLFQIDGGQSYSDTPIRTVVYPSYGPNEPRSRVLIVSYAWTQDAERLGSLMGASKEDKSFLQNMVLRDLERVHKLNEGDLNQYFDGSNDSIFPFNWYADPYAMGAFAFFGPGDFKTVYPNVTLPECNGLLHFAGEATSSEHAWVAGALESAHRAVQEIFSVHGTTKETKETIDKFKQKWGVNQEWADDDLTRHIHLGKEAWKLGHQKS